MSNKQPELINNIPFLVFSIAVAVWVLWYALYAPAREAQQSKALVATAQEQAAEEMILPRAGVVLPIRLGNLGPDLADTGVIDREKFLALYSGEKKKIAEDLLVGTTDATFTITRENAPMFLNFMWALGLGNENKVLTDGPMMDPQYKGAGNFASTGGWTLAQGDAMGHYSKHAFVTLTPDEQTLVEKVSQNIYRPCCDNPTYFPDCNHGMAMLGLLELLASQGATEDEMYRVALAVNSYWFPDTYLTIAEYLRMNGSSWDTTAPRVILGKDYSSASGFQKVMAKVQPKARSGGSCGV